MCGNSKECFIKSHGALSSQRDRVAYESPSASWGGCGVGGVGVGCVWGGCGVGVRGSYYYSLFHCVFICLI